MDSQIKRYYNTVTLSDLIFLIDQKDFFYNLYSKFDENRDPQFEFKEELKLVLEMVPFFSQRMLMVVLGHLQKEKEFEIQKTFLDSFEKTHQFDSLPDLFRKDLNLLSKSFYLNE